MNSLFMDVAIDPFEEAVFSIGPALISVGVLVFASMIAAGVVVAVVVTKKKRKNRENREK